MDLSQAKSGFHSRVEEQNDEDEDDQIYRSGSLHGLQSESSSDAHISAP